MWSSEAQSQKFNLELKGLISEVSFEAQKRNLKSSSISSHKSSIGDPIISLRSSITSIRQLKMEDNKFSQMGKNTINKNTPRKHFEQLPERFLVPPTAKPQTKNLDFRGFDSSIFLCIRGRFPLHDLDPPKV